jgi:hypothetical protein
MYKLNNKYLSTLSFMLATIPGALAGEVMDQLVENGKVSGNLRFYHFTRTYDNDSLTDTHAFSLAGKVKAETGSFNGFSAAIAYYFANDLGLSNHEDNNSHLTFALMGKGHDINTIGEAYLQYQNDLLLIRAGRQTLDTPWMNASDAMAVPNLYEGVAAAVTPMSGLKIETERIWAFKDRTSSSFDRRTVLASPNSKPSVTEDTDGALALGLTYKQENISAKAWAYKFYDIADLAYVQGGYILPAMGKVKPFVDLQYMKQTDTGEALAGSVSSQAYGVKVGLTLPDKLGNIYLAYNEVPHNDEAGVTNGNLVSPYTQGYVTDPLYTSGLNYGMVAARAAGHAWQLGMKLNPWGEKLDIVPTISTYHTEPYVDNVQTYTFDVSYHLSDQFKGWTLRNRLGINHGNPQWGDVTIDNRVMITYAY